LKRATVEAGIYFYDLKTAAAIIFISNPNLRFKDGFAFALGCLTVCVTRAGAGGGTLSDWKNAEA